MMSYAPLRRLVGITAMIVALTIAIVVPAGFALQQVLIETRLLRFKARASAIKVSRFVYAYPTLWQYQGDRISQVIVLPPEDAVKQTILDLQGDVVLDEGETPAFPTLRAEVPIVVDGVQVGRMIVATTLLPVIMEASLVLVLSWLLAGGAFVAVRWLPVRALDRTLGDLARQRAHFKAALDHMTQALCMLDDTQHVAVVNGRFTAMFGGPDAPSLIGIPVTELVDRLVTDAGVNRSACESVLMGTTAATSAIAAMTDGRRINISRSGSQAGLWVATFEDITDRWRAEEAEADRTRALSEARLLREKERAAQETSRAKSLFLATMSHEIRTPLNAVLGLASSLLDGPLDEEQRVVVSTIHDSGESLLRILNDILDYSKLEAGRMELEKVAFSPTEITETLQAVMGPRARAKGLSFYIWVDSSLPVLLVGDPGRLRQVLLNLVSNAVKFTDHGTVTVEASYLTIGAAGATVEWRVHDTGIGIAEDKVEGLFSEFVQADGSINRRFGGSGLGLAISRRLAEQMGGTITVTSKLEQGSTFAFRVQLPIGTSTTEPPVVGLHPVQAIEDLIARMGRPLRILIAEDNETNQFVIRHMLKGFDIQVEIAKDGLEAITAAERSRQDAICMDMQMPEMDGLSATRTIRAKGGWQATVPIIALTGNAFQDDMQACLDAGMNAFIAKPVSRGQFLQTLADEISRCDHVPGRAPAQSSGDRHHIGPIRNNDEPRSYPAEPVVTAT